MSGCAKGILDFLPHSNGKAMDTIMRFYRFQAIAAVCANGRPTMEQLRMNGML